MFTPSQNLDSQSIRSNNEGAVSSAFKPEARNANGESHRGAAAQKAAADVVDPCEDVPLLGPRSNFNVFFRKGVISCSHTEEISDGMAEHIAFCTLLSYQ